MNEAEIKRVLTNHNIDFSDFSFLLTRSQCVCEGEYEGICGGGSVNCVDIFGALCNPCQAKKSMEEFKVVMNNFRKDVVTNRKVYFKKLKEIHNP